MADGGALASLTIIDLCQKGAGSYAAQLLADCGAEVIKVTRTRQAENAAAGQGKLEIGLDYGTAAGASLLATILEHCDGLLEDASSSRATLPALESERLLASIPRLVICTAVDSATAAKKPEAEDGPSAAEVLTGLQVFTGFLAALWQAAETEHGQTMEVRGAEALVSLSDDAVAGSLLSSFSFILNNTTPQRTAKAAGGADTEYLLQTYAELDASAIESLRQEGII